MCQVFPSPNNHLAPRGNKEMLFLRVFPLYSVSNFSFRTHENTRINDEAAAKGVNFVD